MNAGHRLMDALSDRYAIEAEIDTGGMATVYRARDLKHERTVAIKVLRPDLGEAIGQDRFLKEIRTTANLSHPHILPLFDSGEAGGLLYYVMPFVEGESLADRLEREGQLPVEDAVQIAREVAEALDYAHEKGVIHRDIKPANIMLERGHALLMDFGIAQAKAGADETRLTGMGMSLGTPAYMSPEQISGEGTVDGRSDQYALACVLYEMLAGHPPFTGSDIQTVMRQHLAAEAPRVTGARATVPAGVGKAIHRAMAKTPADRYRTVAEFEKALAGATLPLLARIPVGGARPVLYAAAAVVVLALIWGVWVRDTGISGPDPTADAEWQPDPQRIAVAPFRNHSGMPALDVSGKRLSLNISLLLDRAGIGTVVEARRAMGAVAETGPEADPVTILAQTLGAGIVVVGDIFVQGDSLEIWASCVDGRTGESLFPIEPVRGPVTGEGAITAQIQTRVAAVLAQHLDPTMGAGLDFADPARSLEAYQEWGLGWEVLEQGGTFRDAFPHWWRAWEMDSTFLTPLFDLADSYALGSPGQRPVFDSIWGLLESTRPRMTSRDRQEMDIIRLVADGDWEMAYQRGARLAEEWPLEMASGMGWVSFVTNRPGEGVRWAALLDKGDGQFLEPFVASWMGYWSHYTYVLHLVGDYRKELDIALEWRRRFPQATRYWTGAEAKARIGLGDLEGLDPIIDLYREQGWLEPLVGLADEMRAHGHEEAARAFLEEEVARFETADAYLRSGGQNRAPVLYRLGRIEEAHALWDANVNVTREDPNVSSLARLGFSAALTGDTAQAREMEARLAGLPEYYDPDMEFHRAKVVAVLGEKDRAVDILRDWATSGKEQFWPSYLHSDYTLNSLLGDHPGFVELKRPKG